MEFLAKIINGTVNYFLIKAPAQMFDSVVSTHGSTGLLNIVMTLATTGNGQG